MGVDVTRATLALDRLFTHQLTRKYTSVFNATKNTLDAIYLPQLCTFLVWCVCVCVCVCVLCVLTQYVYLLSMRTHIKLLYLIDVDQA